MTSASIEQILHAVGVSAGVDANAAQVVHAGENTTYRLSRGIIARITRPGQIAAARREIAIVRWLSAAGIAAVRAVEDVVQPVEIDDRAVTFWDELPPTLPAPQNRLPGSFGGCTPYPHPANRP